MQEGCVRSMRNRKSRALKASLSGGPGKVSDGGDSHSRYTEANIKRLVREAESSSTLSTSLNRGITAEH